MSGIITILGLGAGELDQLTMGVYRKIKEADHLFVRTKEHPVIEELEKRGVQYKSKTLFPCQTKKSTLK
ncbi:hypothetical protein L2I54_06135 [Bacillus cereus]|nr:hypothetical protein [Bacillus cereus]UUE91714.1 hypothetical protein L2I54_06135 [Bacillus cereus]